MTWPPNLADYIWERDDATCVYCGATLDLQIDHVVPKSRGGIEVAGNGVLACCSCNMKKSNDLVIGTLVFAFRYLLSKGENLDWIDEALMKVGYSPYIPARWLEIDDVVGEDNEDEDEEEDYTIDDEVIEVNEDVTEEFDVTFDAPCYRFALKKEDDSYLRGCYITYVVQCEKVNDTVTSLSEYPITRCQVGNNNCEFHSLEEFSLKVGRTIERMLPYGKKI